MVKSLNASNINYGSAEKRIAITHASGSDSLDYCTSYTIACISALIKRSNPNVQTFYTEAIDEMLQADEIWCSASSQMMNRVNKYGKTLTDAGKTFIVGGQHISMLPQTLKYGTAFIGPLEDVRSIDELPFIDLEVFAKDYLSDKQITVMSSRGYPFSCNYCSSQVFWDKYFCQSPKRFVSELKHIASYGVTNINIFDDLFVMSIDRLRNIVELIESEGLNQLNYSCLIRSDILNEEIINLLKRMNVTTVAFGAESGSNRILKLMNKKATVEDHIRAIKLLNENDLVFGSGLIIGYPGEDRASLEQSIEFIKTYDRHNSIVFFPAIPYPGTKLWDFFVEKYNINIHNFDWDYLSLEGNKFNPDKYYNLCEGISNEDIDATIRWNVDRINNNLNPKQKTQDEPCPSIETICIKSKNANCFENEDKQLKNAIEKAILIRQKKLKRHSKSKMKRSLLADKQILLESGYFNKRFYLEVNEDVKKANCDPALHYLTNGWQELRDPCSEFSTAQYLLDNDDVLNAGINPLIHYIKFGKMEKRKITASKLERRNSLVNNTDKEMDYNDKYLSKDEDFISLKKELCILQAENQITKKNYYHKCREARLLEAGLLLGVLQKLFSKIGKKLIEFNEYNTIKKSGLFDVDYYLAKNPDVKYSKMDPLTHYIRSGWIEGRNPSESFVTNDYLVTHSNVAKRGRNPLYHFAKYGRQNSGVNSFHHDQNGNNFGQWYAKEKSIYENDIIKINNQILKFKINPKISIVIPLYDTDNVFLGQSIASIKNQLYSNWELCIGCDNCPQNVVDFLKEIELSDTRINVYYRKENGKISKATNSAISLATGDYIAFMDHDDILPSHALFSVVSEINKKPELSMIFSDEAIIDEDNNLLHEHCKPGFNYQLLLTQNYICHFCVAKKTLVDKLGGLRPAYDGSQDHDFVLRVMDSVPRSQISHIPEILYFWRIFSSSFSNSEGTKFQAIEAGAKAANDHFKRNGIDAVSNIIEYKKGCYYREVEYKMPKRKPSLHLLLIIDEIESKATWKNCKCILKNLIYSNVDVTILYPEQETIKTKKQIETFSKIYTTNSITFKSDSDLIRKKNILIKECDAEVIGIVNVNFSIKDNAWLDHIVSYAIQPHIGIVGCDLLYSNNIIYSSGIILSPDCIINNIYHGYPACTIVGYAGRKFVAQEFSAISDEVVFFRKEVFDLVDGYEGHELNSYYSHIDFCLKVRKIGLSIVHTPKVKFEFTANKLPDLYLAKHREKASIDEFVAKWHDEIKQDKYLNPNLLPNYMLKSVKALSIMV